MSEMDAKNRSPKFAYVRYVASKQNKIINVQELYNFKPQHMMDFVATKQYEDVSGKPTDNLVQILKLGETIPSLESSIKRKRVRMASCRLLQSPDEVKLLSKEAADPNNSLTTIEAKLKRKEFSIRSDDETDISDDEEFVNSGELTSLRNECTKLKSKVEKMYKNQSVLEAKLGALEKENSQTKQQNEVLKQKVDFLSRVNEKLQTTVIKAFEPLKDILNKVARSDNFKMLDLSKVCTISNIEAEERDALQASEKFSLSLNSGPVVPFVPYEIGSQEADLFASELERTESPTPESSNKNTDQLSKEESTAKNNNNGQVTEESNTTNRFLKFFKEDDPVFLQKEKFIHVGQGYAIPSQHFESANLATTDSIFCQNLAMVIWGPEALKKRSVTGLQSNRYPMTEKKIKCTPEKVMSIQRCLQERMKKRGAPETEIAKADSRKAIKRKIGELCRKPKIRTCSTSSPELPQE